MTEKPNPKPDNTAVRVALWRAMHVQIDPPPHVFEDEVGLQLVDPDPNWHQRPDMNPQMMRRIRLDIVSRARFIEDMVMEQAKQDLKQYVILGAGLDTFVQRRPDIASKLKIFEIDKEETQIWKQQRLKELGFGIPNWLRFVSVDFESESWWERLLASGFNRSESTIITSAGVSQYLTKEATLETFANVLSMPSGSTFLMTFLIPLDRVDPEDRPMYEISMKGAKAAGNPFIGLYTPSEMETLAKKVGFKEVKIVSTDDFVKRYFSSRKDDLRPATGEEILVAKT